MVLPGPVLGLTTRLRHVLPDPSLLTGLHAFALEELGECAKAARLAEQAMAANAEDTWAVHALAHALYEMAEHDDGLRRVPPAIERCTRVGWYRNHLLWHLILMHLARGEYERAMAMTHDVFEREPSPVTLDVRNAISLLWRYELCGRDVKSRWRPFVELVRPKMTRTEDLPFHHVHVAMTLAAGGDWRAGDAHFDFLRGRTARDRGGLLAEVVIPLCEGMRAFAAGDWPGTIAAVEPIRTRIVEVGGSRAQRDVFHDTLLEACFRAGDAERGERYLAERIARRPDHYWVHRRASAERA